jgi:tetratricopeptide (TPR) repeat protein
MKKILVTVVLGAAVAAAGQGGTAPAQQPQGQPAQGQQPAASQAQAPVIKDPAEYNAYVAAYQQSDPKAKISGLEAFLTQYPNSVMKVQALEILMATYQQTNNIDKTADAAKRLLQADPKNVKAMFILAYLDRVRAQGGAPNAQQLLTEGGQYGEQGLAALPSFTKPEGTSDADFKKMKDQMTGQFDAVVGLAAYQAKDYPKAQKYLRAAADLNPTDFSIIAPLALSYVEPTPPDYLNGVWYLARAAAVAPAPQSEQQFEKYAKSKYVKYHGGDDGWNEAFAQAKAGTTPPENWIKPAPTPAEQAHAMVAATAPDKMDFAQWEFILSNGNQADQDTVWNAIKGKAVQMNGTVITASATEFNIAGSSDDIEAKKADIKLTFEETVPAKLIPKEGASLDFQGEPASYTSNPFMMVMEKGKLLKAATPTPAKKPPVHHKPAAKPAGQ